MQFCTFLRGFLPKKPFRSSFSFWQWLSRCFYIKKLDFYQDFFLESFSEIPFDDYFSMKKHFWRCFRVGAKGQVVLHSVGNALKSTHCFLFLESIILPPPKLPGFCVSSPVLHNTVPPQSSMQFSREMNNSLPVWNRKSSPFFWLYNPI